tara:strand:+ start:30 stop:323 length:294 start_codon:yes stop_codon:yes gene_type:complete
VSILTTKQVHVALQGVLDSQMAALQGMGMTLEEELLCTNIATLVERVLRFLIIIFQPGYTGTKDLKVYPLLYSPTGTIKLVLLTLFNPTFLKLDKLN